MRKQRFSEVRCAVFASFSTETIIGDEREPRRTKWRNQSRVAETWRGPEATGRTTGQKMYGAVRSERKRKKERRRAKKKKGKRERQRARKRKGGSVTVARNKVKLTS